jgi:hypothetical protein
VSEAMRLAGCRAVASGPVSAETSADEPRHWFTCGVPEIAAASAGSGATALKTVGISCEQVWLLRRVGARLIPVVYRRGCARDDVGWVREPSRFMR